MKKILYILFFLLFLNPFFSPVFDAQAQTAGLKITPIIIEELVEPGQTLTGAITVTNQSAEAKNLFVYLRDFKGEGESGNAKLIEPGSEEGYFLASWVDITNESISFGPNEEKEIPFKVMVPIETGPGGYYGAIVFGTEPPKININSPEQGAGLAVSQQAASLLLLKVKGDIYEEADIREFVTDKGLYNTPFEVKFNTRIQNKSNVHIKPIGEISVKNFLGKEVAKIPFNDKGSNILPDTFRRYENDWAGENGFGKYSASLILSYGTPANQGGPGMQTLSIDNYFWIMPWKIIIIIVSSLVFLISLSWLLLKLYKNKAIKRAMAEAGMAQVKYVKTLEGPSPTVHIGLIILVLLLVLFVIMSFVFFLFFA